MARILLMEDSATMRRLLVRVLTDAGHKVIESSTGFAAYDSKTLDKIDLMITDLVMPRVDGLDAIRTALSKRKNLKIIAISGGSPNLHHDYLRVAKTFGAAKVLQKPFEAKSLIAAVNGALAA